VSPLPPAAAPGRPRTLERPPAFRSVGPIAFAMLVVVVSFSVSLWFSHWRLRSIDRQVEEIVGDAMPSVEHLGSVRTELRRLGMYTGEYATGLSEATRPTREDIRGTRAQLRADFMAFREHPSFPGETALATEVMAELAALDESMEQVLREADSGARDAAIMTLHRDFQPRLERTDLAIVRLKVFNTEQASAQADSIMRSRGDAAAAATVLGLVSLAVAALATVLVVRALRDRARLVEDHGRLLAVRATELEAFAGHVAHDLKDPLGAMALRILAAGRRGEIPSWLQAELDKLTGQVQRLNRIIDSLLEFARAGANPPPGAQAQLRDILEEVAREVRPAAEAASAELRVDPFSPTSLACTPGALTSVISNMLGNAVKYIAQSASVPRRISVHVVDLDQAVRVEIQDNGPGLPAGSEGLVFEPFYRLADHHVPGIGIGLATVRRIVEAYGGRIGVRSKAGEGSTFWFELRKAPGVAPEPPGQGPPPGPEAPQPGPVA